MSGVLATSTPAGVSLPNGGGVLQGGGELAMNLSVLVMAVMVTVFVISAYAVPLELFRGLLPSTVTRCTNWYHDIQPSPMVPGAGKKLLCDEPLAR